MTDRQRTAPHTGRHLKFSDLRHGGVRAFAYVPDDDTAREIMAALDLSRLDKVRLAGTLTPAEAGGWDLTASLGATVTQPCVATLDPVRTRIDSEVLRRYRPDFHIPQDGGEMEMPDDDTAEPLPTTLDIGGLLLEELSLAIPAFPRAEDSDLGPRLFAEPGTTPMTDDDAKPFAVLGALRRGAADKP
jgi:uncharacterized metal-binding protein YceD (DUF177 family)